MSDTQRPEPDESTEILPVVEAQEPETVQEEEPAEAPAPSSTDESFTPEELRQIKIGVAIQLEAQKKAEPLEVHIPQQAEPIFEGTYNRRPHWMSAIRSNIIAPLMILAIWVLSFMAGSYLLSIIQYSPELESKLGLAAFDDWISTWIPVIIASLATLWILWAATPFFLSWVYDKRTVTPTQIVLSRNVPGFFRNLLFKVDDYAVKIDRKDVRSVEFKRDGVGEFFGYTTATFETWVQADEAFHNVPFISHPEEIRMLFPIDNLGDPDTY